MMAAITTAILSLGTATITAAAEDEGPAARIFVRYHEAIVIEDGRI